MIPTENSIASELIRRDEVMKDIFGEAADNRTPVNKVELDSMKLECFNKILDNSHRYYNEFYTSEGVEYGFDSEEFGEWVERQIVEFHNLKEEEN